ncbi:MAG: hypothetical protein GY923_12005 [Aestuariibacter sp.]|jgi:hypothetical protein|uniref:hypothetical protein n=1 Tax=Marisediminitalea aggregata TaxID=634436 RepID=UPI0020CD8DAF|nr:hypothetical protein [Marisediminitalea aggregata]MCP3865133.1 hypothetical protein [Aestuariibacter sp.]MCP4527033.1 hypothetical protein [Aestuariibacter sp.]MCP4948212.1 hypothetical protein [Aestuariibacter sp.]MCP9476465.1 hypothetical protein [Marisediminitalea aggregata]
MYNFSDYKLLKNPVRSIASRYWSEVIRQRLGATCANQILAAHLDDHSKSTPGWSENSSRFWNHMLSGKPAGIESKVEQSEKIAPGTKNILLHPLWQLINSKSPDEEHLLDVLAALPYELHSRLITRDLNGQRSFKKKIHPKTKRNLFEMTSIDSLTIWLVLVKREQLAGTSEIPCPSEVHVIRVFFRLVVLNEFSVITTDLYHLISEFFGKDSAHSATETYNQLPIEVLPVNLCSPEQIATMLQRTLAALAGANFIEDSPEGKERFLRSINHSNSHNLLQDLVLLANGTLDRGSIGRDALEAMDRYEQETAFLVKRKV